LKNNSNISKPKLKALVMAWLNLQFDPSSENGLHTRCCQQQGIYTRCYKKSSGRMKVINHHTT
jgi:hypothetical protein